MSHNPITKAVNILGVQGLTNATGVTRPAWRRWEMQGRMPRTEFTGETKYAEAIERATQGQVTKSELLAGWPGGEVLNIRRRPRRPRMGLAQTECIGNAKEFG